MIVLHCDDNDDDVDVDDEDDMMIRVDANDHLLVIFLIAYHFNKCFQVLFKTLQHRQLQNTE